MKTSSFFHPRSRSRLRAIGKATKRGFTLMELLVVISLIALLTAIAAPIYNKYKVQGLDTRKRAIIQAVADAKKAFWHDPNTTIAQQAAFNSANNTARLAMLEININNKPVANLAELVAGTEQTSMTIGDMSTAPTIP